MGRFIYLPTTVSHHQKISECQEPWEQDKKACAQEKKNEEVEELREKEFIDELKQDIEKDDIAEDEQMRVDNRTQMELENDHVETKRPNRKVAKRKCFCCDQDTEKHEVGVSC